MRADKGRRFENRLKKANNHDLPRMMYESRAERQQTPCQTGECEPDPRSDLLHHEVVRDLTDAIACVYTHNTVS
jgi:hypothetical protein